jgi:hypothetical protein
MRGGVTGMEIVTASAWWGDWRTEALAAWMATRCRRFIADRTQSS